MSHIEHYTPHMSAYADDFADSGKINWMPYLMYFHPYNYCSAVVNTDQFGFRYSEVNNQKYAVGDIDPEQPVRLIAGSSTVFGIGASQDRYTLASLMSKYDPRNEPWLNFGGRSFNSTQELILFTLNRHRLKHVKEIVLFSGFNDLGLARLPASLRMEHGAFFMCRDFFDAFKQKKNSGFSSWFGKSDDGPDENIPTLDEQMDYAVSLTTRHIASWNALAKDMGATLTFVLQPLANWVRENCSKEEQDIFSELEARGNFEEMYGDILSKDVCQKYADEIEKETRRLGVRFINFSPILDAATTSDDWLFVDRIHFTDTGHDIVSRLLLNELTKRETADEEIHEKNQEHVFER
ncbi:SGNH/GDSL hydrolase family protein [Photobacterium sp. 1_MG-2023]|uniref:SGNH/GDSL hydrolase family protein n=1 Tax=Photobacterium sp. 1_MG-2023 TaxID=3062646 RepID=UPI0026E302ED|nr:SGNH/GDSL hydrolase family protein [Photobacterium sp. 1_MG-2023]MDO6705845.1 SGNH/GDSL hydrolase family protein [Photobacterium sp. 1_MG-2023]